MFLQNYIVLVCLDGHITPRIFVDLDDALDLSKEIYRDLNAQGLLYNHATKEPIHGWKNGYGSKADEERANTNFREMVNSTLDNSKSFVAWSATDPKGPRSECNSHCTIIRVSNLIMTGVS